MRTLKALIALSLVSVSWASETSKDGSPILVVLNEESTIDLNRLLHASGCEFMRQRISETKGWIECNEEGETEALRADLKMYERGLSELKKTGKAWRGGHTVTISEEGEGLVVAYFIPERGTQSAFVCLLSKKDYAVMQPSALLRKKTANLQFEQINELK